MNCTCDKCKNACINRPGFFLPDEIEPAARSKGMSVKDYFNKYLVVDYFLKGDYYKRDVFILAPGTMKSDCGREAPFNPKGHCVFFNKKELCDIHTVKPRECAVADHIITEKNYRKERMEIVKAWDNRQSQDMIRELLGREPIVPKPTMSDIIQMDPSLDPFA
jgi:Fe-S-cluster containining protein